VTDLIAVRSAVRPLTDLLRFSRKALLHAGSREVGVTASGTLTDLSAQNCLI
jgi:hypothetical protein